MTVPLIPLNRPNDQQSSKKTDQKKNAGRKANETEVHNGCGFIFSVVS